MKSSAYADLFVRLAGTTMQCRACLRATTFRSFKESLAGGWQWELEPTRRGTRIAWTCGDCAAPAPAFIAPGVVVRQRSAR